MYLGIDVGGTKTLLGSFDDSGKLLQKVRFATPQSYEEFLKEFQKGLTSLSIEPLKGAVAAIPGKIDRTNGVGLEFGNLPWKNVPIREDIGKLISCPILIENDAKVGGLSEAILIIDEFKKVLYITIGTGIGISIIANGIIDINSDDLGGHNFIVEHKGNKQAWEDFAAGSAIKERYGRQAAEITETETWKAIVKDFAAGLIPLCESVKPDVVIIGGGVGTHFDRFGKLLEEELAPLPSTPVLRAAQRPEEAVLYGCYELAKKNYG